MRALLPLLSLTLTLPPPSSTAEARARHLLQRLTFGARAQEIEKLAAGGDAAIQAWIEDQMRPGADPRIEKQLAVFSTLSLSIPDLQQKFPRPEVVAKKAGLDPKDKEEDKERLKELIPFEQRPARIEEELQSAKLIRATLSSRQLEERLVDFWFNHFNVDLGKSEARWFVGSFERDAIRPRVFGSFRDLLGATAHHPAMLWYLDNWMSVRDGFDPKQYARLDNPRAIARRDRQEAQMLRDEQRSLQGRPANQPNLRTLQGPTPEAQKRPMGLNENYARELLELHTLGVDGGYSQSDVREVARCFTGWTIDKPREGAEGRFRPMAHDSGDKLVLGQKIADGGIRDGEHVLDLLARHPSTARFIATKLCRYFVADAPPEALVKRVADVFMKTGGDLPKVYSAIFSSPEFWSAPEAKVKSPFEVVVSSLRALNATIEDPLPLTRQVARMGQPLYRCAPPTGYKDAAETWVSSGALVNRLQWGLALGRQQVKAVSWNQEDLRAPSNAETPAAALDRISQRLLGRPLSEASREALLKEIQEDPHPAVDGERRPVDAARLMGLILGSPEFQRR
jgi:uncharacterized protein (DUF1800 family)